jgi:hypothetical protein
VGWILNLYAERREKRLLGRSKWKLVPWGKHFAVPINNDVLVIDGWGGNDFVDVLPCDQKARGYPPDISKELIASDELIQQSIENGLDDEARGLASWLTLTELLALDWSIVGDDEDGDSVGFFASVVLQQLHSLGSPDDIRVVYYFY